MHADHDCLNMPKLDRRDRSVSGRVAARCSPIRRGNTTAGVVTVCALLSSLLVAAFVVNPVSLQAGRAGTAAVQASSRAHQQVIEQIAALIGRSHAVLATHERANAAFTEIVLWLEDSTGDGHVHAQDIAVISHSPLLQTINIYLAEEAKPRGLDPGWWHPTHLRERDFCDRWRACPEVRPRLLAAGLSDMQVQWLAESAEGVVDAVDRSSRTVRSEQTGRLQLALTWAPNSSDGADKASVVIATR